MPTDIFDMKRFVLGEIIELRGVRFEIVGGDADNLVLRKPLASISFSRESNILLDNAERGSAQENGLGTGVAVESD